MPRIPPANATFPRVPFVVACPSFRADGEPDVVVSFLRGDHQRILQLAGDAEAVACPGDGIVMVADVYLVVVEYVDLDTVN